MGGCERRRDAGAAATGVGAMDKAEGAVATAIRRCSKSHYIRAANLFLGGQQMLERFAAAAGLV